MARNDLSEQANHHALLSLLFWEIEIFLHDTAQTEPVRPEPVGQAAPGTVAQLGQRAVQGEWAGPSSARARRAGGHSDSGRITKVPFGARKRGRRVPFARRRNAPRPGPWHVRPEMQHTVLFVLGLKGTMSEAELHILKQRMNQGRLSKAGRGELQFALPIGYIWSPTGEIQFDPDEQVQQVVRFIFHQFEDLGTLGGLVRYLAHHQIQLGVRVREGQGYGERTRSDL